MATHLEQAYNVNYAGMSFTESCVCISKLQSIMKDICDEMTNFDESVARVLLRREAELLYTQATSIDPDTLSAAIEQEELSRQGTAIR